MVETSWWVELVDVWRRAMGERGVEGWGCGVYIHVRVTLWHVHVEMWICGIFIGLSMKRASLV